MSRKQHLTPNPSPYQEEENRHQNRRVLFPLVLLLVLRALSIGSWYCADGSRCLISAAVHPSHPVRTCCQKQGASFVPSVSSAQTVRTNCCHIVSTHFLATVEKQQIISSDTIAVLPLPFVTVFPPAANVVLTYDANAPPVPRSLSAAPPPGRAPPFCS